MGQKQQQDNTGQAMRDAQNAAVRQAEIAAAAARAQQEASLKAAKESIANIQKATGKTAQQYVEEAQQSYQAIIPKVTSEYQAKLQAFDPEAVLKPYSESATKGVQAAGGYMGEKVKQDVGEFGQMLATGTTIAGQQLSQFSKQAAKQQSKAFKQFQQAATTAQAQGLAQASAITQGLSNLYNPEYQALLSKSAGKELTARSSVLEDILAKSLYPNV